MNNKSKTIAVIVAHPDDETLWAGGTILLHTTWHFFVACLCRAGDRERAPKFYKALNILNSEGIMGDLDDSPELKTLNENEVECAILDILPQKHFDLVITHNPTGEYTRHLRHEQVSKAVINLWNNGKISAYELYTFAYEDDNKKYYPRPQEDAPVYFSLTKRIWLMKYKIITETYGFEKNSWESKSTTRAESFWKFTKPADAKRWLENGGVLL